MIASSAVHITKKETNKERKIRGIGVKYLRRIYQDALRETSFLFPFFLVIFS